MDVLELIEYGLRLGLKVAVCVHFTFSVSVLRM